MKVKCNSKLKTEMSIMLSGIPSGLEKKVDQKQQKTSTNF